MSVELPARIGILGAGPIGLETALYARCLGYDVDVYERGRVAEHLLRWGHARLFTPFGATATTLGQAALAAQDAGWKPPADDALLTGREIVEQYYGPLAQTDLLVDHIHLGVEGLAISRGTLLKGELAGEERAAADFRLLIAGDRRAGSNAAPEEKIAAADVVVDATGNYAQHNWLGAGGIPAIGELGAQDHIEYGLPDILGRDRADYAHRHTLLVGSGHAAAACAVALAQLGHEAPFTRFTWIVRCDLEGKFDPIRHIENDPWPAQSAGDNGQPIDSRRAGPPGVLSGDFGRRSCLARWIRAISCSPRWKARRRIGGRPDHCRRWPSWRQQSLCRTPSIGRSAAGSAAKLFSGNRLASFV